MSLTEQEKNDLWGSLKRQWGVIKDPTKTEMEKQTAKESINHIQKKLSLEITDWTKPFRKQTQKYEDSSQTVLDLHSRQIAELTRELNAIKSKLGLV